MDDKSSDKNQNLSLDELKSRILTEHLAIHQKYDYTKQLLEYSLENRDTDTASLVAQQMDIEPQLDADLYEDMLAYLEETPDLVYVFIRQRLSESVTPKWLERLKVAAERSLQVASDSCDPELVLSWLRLIAREPDMFQLDSILQHGIIQAIPCAYENSAIAEGLLMLTSRFSPHQLVELYKDVSFIEALPHKLRQFLSGDYYEGVLEISTSSNALFLAVMMPAAQNQSAEAFALEEVKYLWELSQSDNLKLHPQSPYTPSAILNMCVDTGLGWFPTDSVAFLFAWLLTQDDVTHLVQFIQHFSEDSDTLIELLATALTQGELDAARTLDHLRKLDSLDILSNQMTFQLYFDILEQFNWTVETQPIIYVLIDKIAQSDISSLTTSYMRKIVAVCREFQDASMTVVPSVKLLEILAQNPEDDEFIESLQDMLNPDSWEPAVYPIVFDWWRSFVQTQSSSVLTYLDQSLKDNRSIEDAYAILQSTIAIRRLVTNGDVSHFAEEINVATTVMRALVAAFESQDKSNAPFDLVTFENFLVHMMTSLTTQQRQVFANSLKELAGLVSQMGDNRTKGGLGRRTIELDQRFMDGKQPPQSAVDFMKWIAGFVIRHQKMEIPHDQNHV